MQKTLTGKTNPDGSPEYDYALSPDEVAAGKALFLTGPIAGTISMADGTAYDVTDTVILVNATHIRELQLSIHKAHHAAGRFLDAPLPTLEPDAPPTTA